MIRIQNLNRKYRNKKWRLLHTVVTKMICNKSEPSRVAGPIYFVHQHLAEEWSDLVGNESPGPSSSFLNRYQNGRDDWIIKTYLELLNRGNNVKLSDHFVAGAICVAHHDHILGVREAARSYVVAVKADRRCTVTCENEIVQSPSSLVNESDYYIPFWSQSDLIPRNRRRFFTVLTLAFMGEERNFSAWTFKSMVGLVGTIIRI